MEKFNQLCVWYATVIGKENIKALEKFFLTEFGVRVKYRDEVITLPDSTGPGGRNDAFFYIHDDDIEKFAVPRFSIGVRWWEDVISNGGAHLYPKSFLEQNPTNW